ncbi:hypothetical protein IGJ41_000309 [Enterococcus sp. DIV1537a]|uniref:distal tail protein Dit n=1 Tax=Enterococcus sp. DIV1537a TaxID=2774733 RepID=UPI003F20089D
MSSYIEFSGKKSTDFHLRIMNGITFSTASRDIRLEEIEGVDGSVILSNNRMKDIDQSFPCILTLPEGGTIEKATTALSNWLHGQSGWGDLIWSGDPEYVYTALYYEQTDVQHVLHTFGKCVLKFKLKPYKYLKEGLKERVLLTDGALTNVGTRVAKPLITIKGSGDITLIINGKNYVFKSVDRELTIDCLAETATGINNQPAYDKVYTYPFPIFPIGNVKITWIGRIKEMKITPRWEVLV